MEQTYTAKQLAEIMKKSKQAIMKRAQKGDWKYINGNGKGGNYCKYPLSALPPDVQESILIYTQGSGTGDQGSGMTQTRNMLPALSPSVASKALDILSPLPIPTLNHFVPEKDRMSD